MPMEAATPQTVYGHDRCLFLNGLCAHTALVSVLGIKRAFGAIDCTSLLLVTNRSCMMQVLDSYRVPINKHVPLAKI